MVRRSGRIRDEGGGGRLRERNGIPYRVEGPKPQTRKVLSYSDNFAPNRIVPWSH